MTFCKSETLLQHALLFQIYSKSYFSDSNFEESLKFSAKPFWQTEQNALNIIYANFLNIFHLCGQCKYDHGPYEMGLRATHGPRAAGFSSVYLNIFWSKKLSIRLQLCLIFLQIINFLVKFKNIVKMVCVDRELPLYFSSLFCHQ